MFFEDDSDYDEEEFYDIDIWVDPDFDLISNNDMHVSFYPWWFVFLPERGSRFNPS